MRVSYCFLLCMSCLISCMNEELEGDSMQEETPLTFSVGLDHYGFKSDRWSDAEIEGALGVSVSDESGSMYGGRLYDNVLYERVGQTWKADADIMLSSLEGTLNAYWPYDPDVSTLRSVPVTALTQTDYLYAEKVEGLSKYNPDAFIRFRHALSAVRLVLVKGDYPGAGNVTQVQIRGDGVPVSAVLDACTGEVRSGSGFGQLMKVGVDMQISLAPQSYDVFLLPTEEEHCLDVSVVVDGVKRSIRLDGIGLSQGVMTRIVLVVNDDELVLTGVELQDWALEIEQFRVYVGGNTTGVAFSHMVDNEGVVTVMAVPVDNFGAVDEVSVEGECACEQYIDAETGVRTLVLSELNEDVMLRFNGAWSTLFLQEFDIDPDYVGKDVLLFRSDCYSQIAGKLEYMEVDGSLYPLSQYFKFTQHGLHRVKVYMPADSEINVSGGSQRHLVHVEVPFCTKTLKKNAFSLSPLLKSVVIPGSVYEIEDYAFVDCVSLESVSLNVGLKCIGYRAFDNCVSLKGLSLPNGLETISSLAFYKCGALEAIDIPQTVTFVGIRAFSGCSSLRELAFCKGESEVVVSGPILENCNSLLRLTLPENLSRTGLICSDCPLLSDVKTYDSTCPMRIGVSDYAFSGLSLSGVLTVPQGAQRYETWIEDLGAGWRLEYSDDL